MSAIEIDQGEVFVKKDRWSGAAYQLRDFQEKSVESLKWWGWRMELRKAMMGRLEARSEQRWGLVLPEQ